MSAAMLSADYLDKGRKHTVDVLEEIRDGFLAKLGQANYALSDAVGGDDPVAYAVSIARCEFWQTAIDDVAWHIQREQARS